MSSAYQPKTKELAKVKVVTSQTCSENRSKYKSVESVQRTYANSVTAQRNGKTW